MLKLSLKGGTACNLFTYPYNINTQLINLLFDMLSACRKHPLYNGKLISINSGGNQK